MFVIFEFVEEIDYRGIKVALHFLGFKGNFTVYARTEKVTFIEKGKTIKEVKEKALNQIEIFYK